MTRAVWLPLLLFGIALWIGACALITATNPCAEWRWSPIPIRELQGWQGGPAEQVKCYHGEVVDYRKLDW